MNESDSSSLRIDHRANRPPTSSAKETIFSARTGPVEVPFPAVEFQSFAHARCGATNLSTGLTTLQPRAAIPYHRHDYSEALTVLQGQALIWTEGRCHRLGALDCIHVPRGMAHRAENPDEHMSLWVAHASPVSIDQPVQESFTSLPNGLDTDYRQETIICQASAAMYELAPGSRFYDLFAGRFGSVGVCGGCVS